MTTGRHESCAIVALHRYGADIRPQACMEDAPLWSYATEMQTYDHRHAWKLRHCGVTPLRCKHMTTGRHESCVIVALHRYGADIRPQACMEATPLWSYATEMQTYVHRHAWKLHHCGVTPLWCRHTTTGMHGSYATVELRH